MADVELSALWTIVDELREGAPFLPVVLDCSAELYIVLHPINRHPEWFKIEVCLLAVDILFDKRCDKLTTIGSNATLEEISSALNEALMRKHLALKVWDDRHEDNPQR